MPLTRLRGRFGFSYLLKMQLFTNLSLFLALPVAIDTWILSTCAGTWDSDSNRRCTVSSCRAGTDLVCSVYLIWHFKLDHSFDVGSSRWQIPDPETEHRRSQ